MKDIKAMVERRGLTMADVARTTGLTEAHLSYVANGKRNMTIATAKKLAKVFGVNWWELID